MYLTDSECGARTVLVEKEYFEKWFWGRMQKFIWTDRVTSEKILSGVNEEKDILRTMKGWLNRLVTSCGGTAL